MRDDAWGAIVNGLCFAKLHAYMYECAFGVRIRCGCCASLALDSRVRWVLRRGNAESQDLAYMPKYGLLTHSRSVKTPLADLSYDQVCRTPAHR